MRDFALVLAADMPTATDVVAVVKRVGKIVDGVKVGMSTLLEAGIRILQVIQDALEGKPLLVDLKVADIGFIVSGRWDGTNAKILKQLGNSGASHVTVHGFPGPYSVAEAVYVARDIGLEVLLLPLMSHPGASLFFSRPLGPSDLTSQTRAAGLDVVFSEAVPCRDVTDGILLLGESLGVAGYIGPASRPKDLKRYREITSRPVWCPGFGRQDKLNRTLEEQFRQWAEALGNRSAAIVGSTIFGAPDQVAAAERVVEIRDLVVERVLYIG